MNSVFYQLKCCFGPYGCSCFCISPIRQSIGTRIMYSLMLIIVSTLCIFIHERKWLEQAIHKLGPNANQTCVFLQAEESCERLLGYRAIYRIAYSFAAFHLIMAIFCIQISSSQEWRAKVHNGFWFFKIIVIIGFWIMLFIPPDTEYHMKAATITGVIAALVFIIIQDVSIIDCAYEFNEHLRRKSSKNCCYDKILYIITVILYIATVGGYVWLYLYYALPSVCIRNRVIIIVNATASFIIVLLSFVIGRHNQNKLFIPGGVICVLVAFLTWTAINSSPYEMIALNFKPANPSEARMVSKYDSKNKIYRCQADIKIYSSHHFSKELDTILGTLVMLMTAVYACIRSTVDYKRYGIKPAKSKTFSTSQLQIATNDIELREIKIKSKNRISGSHLINPKGDENDLIRKTNSMPSINLISSKKKKRHVSSSSENIGKVPISDNELVAANKSLSPKRMNDLAEVSSVDESDMNYLKNCPIDSYLIHDEYHYVRYSYSWLHFNFALAYLFVMVQLTNWYSPETSHILNFDKSWPSMWMKIATSWIALGLFSWTLLCPAFCIGRRLYEYPLDSMKRYRHQMKSGQPATVAEKI